MLLWVYLLAHIEKNPCSLPYFSLKLAFLCGWLLRHYFFCNMRVHRQFPAWCIVAPKPVNLIIICFMDLNDLEGRHRNIIFCWWCLLGNKGTIHTNTIIELNIIHRCPSIISVRGWWRICILCISVRLRTIWRLIGIQPLVRTHNDFPFPMYSSRGRIRACSWRTLKFSFFL